MLGYAWLIIFEALENGLQSPPGFWYRFDWGLKLINHLDKVTVRLAPDLVRIGTRTPILKYGIFCIFIGKTSLVYKIDCTTSNTSASAKAIIALDKTALIQKSGRLLLSLSHCYSILTIYNFAIGKILTRISFGGNLSISLIMSPLSRIWLVCDTQLKIYHSNTGVNRVRQI